MSAALTVALNGSDNVGKSTQLRWLATAMPTAHLVGTVDRWHSGWGSVSKGNFAEWWFENSTTEEHTTLILASHLMRRQASRPLALEDRGLPMLLAVCAATAAVKEGVAIDAAFERIGRIAAGILTPKREELQILLRHSASPGREAHLALSREAQTPSPQYKAYQQALAAAVEVQHESGEFDLVLARENRPIVDIQRELRRFLVNRGLEVRNLPDESPKKLWVLGGLSESGKSTVGELLRDEHGVTRLKIGYLVGLAAMRANVEDPYRAWSEETQAEYLAEELLSFIDSNKVQLVSLESAHRLEATRHLRRILGDCCEIVYTEASLESRQARTGESPEDLAARDRIKSERGASKISKYATWVIDNDGSLVSLKFAVQRMVATSVNPRMEIETIPVSNVVRAWLEASTGRLVDAKTAAVIATGSTGRVEWLPSWSDLDLLVIRDELPADWLQSVDLEPPPGLKVGLSFFTTAELDAGRVPPRVWAALRRLNRDGQGVLYARVGYRPPVPESAASDRMSRGELGLILMTLRRLVIAERPDIRALHKHVLLVMKILLRGCACEVEDQAQIVKKFGAIFPDSNIQLPHAKEMITTGGAKPKEKNRSVVAAAKELLNYVDSLDNSLKRGTQHDSGK